MSFSRKKYYLFIRFEHIDFETSRSSPQDYIMYKNSKVAGNPIKTCKCARGTARPRMLEFLFNDDEGKYACNHGGNDKRPGYGFFIHEILHALGTLHYLYFYSVRFIS